MSQESYQIEKLVHGGFGLSRDQDGQVILLEGVIAGETVEARLGDRRKNLTKGAATRILQASPGRISPPCPRYRDCGGCDFQHMEYPLQLAAKKEILRDLLKRSGHPILQEGGDTLLSDPLPSPEQFHYRQRIRLQVDDRRVVGFHKRHSHNCVAVSSCMLAHREINVCLQELVGHASLQKLLANTNSLELLYDPETAGTILFIHFQRKARPADKQHAQTLLRDVETIGNVIFLGDGFAPTDQATLSYSLPQFPPHTTAPLKLSLESGGFCQVNLQQNEQLVRTVLDLCRLEQGDEVLDLFCGMGNFSIPLAEKAGSLLGVEGQGSAIRSARKNSAAVGQVNTEFIKSPIHQACEELAREQRSFDCVLIDPPRQGAPGLADTMAALCRKRLVYVSCDPATLCRDLVHLLEQGFTLKALQPVDMFPQTHHIETVALLKKE